MRKGVMIAGYYGANNTGDEAILTGMIHSLKNEGITDITVLSRNPKQTTMLHDVKSIYIGRKFDGLWNIYKHLRKKELFILGGGGLLQDYSKRVVPYWLIRVLLAFIARTPVMYYAQGIGPLNTPSAIRLVKNTSRYVKRITVRDEESNNLLKAIGVRNKNIEVTADPALAIKIKSDGRQLLKDSKAPIIDNKIKIGVALRNWANEGNYLPVLINSLNKLNENNNIQYYFFPFQFGEDEEISNRVIAELKNKESAFLVERRHSPEEMTAMLKEMDGIIAMRLHAVILSAISTVPSFGLVYDPKVYNFMNRVNLSEYTIAISELNNNEEEFNNKLANWLDKREVLKEQMSEPVNNMITLSEKNAKIARQIINNY